MILRVKHPNRDLYLVMVDIPFSRRAGIGYCRLSEIPEKLSLLTIVIHVKRAIELVSIICKTLRFAMKGDR